MNCEDYRAALTADPEFEEDSGHVHACADCQAYSSEILALNEDIAAAMEITVPDLQLPTLAEIDAENVVTLPERRGLSKPTWLALAATVLLAAVFGIRMTGVGEPYGTLEEQVLAHVDREAAAVAASSTRVSDGRLARTVPRNIATMNHDSGLITYAQSCIINGRTVPHLVIQGERGPITILLMPEETVSEAKTLEGKNIRGIILPVGNGSIAIIGHRDEQLERVKQNVLKSVTWST
ncbi:MAG: DUF3379 family protein [Proteobacteria bacterium]|nr:DUF3379 family protein [Pseudomonadota bacterium]